MSSFKKINYSLRPAKAVERKMISFALKKLNRFENLSNYQYIGFGATTFHDFVLFHKDLGINKMISIEVSGNKQRFDFNKPFHCIEMKYGDSQSILPSVSWGQKTILWLDYDKLISSSSLDDVITFFSSAVSGSVFLLTLNCEPEAYGTDNEQRREKIANDIGIDNLHFGNKMIDFSSKNLPNTLHKIINSKINSTLINRNGLLSNGNQLVYEQLFNFHYADGVKMLTIGGMLVNVADKKLFDLVQFDEYSFIKRNEEVFSIDVPILTTKEIRFLNSKLPNGISEDGIFLVPVPNSVNPNLPSTDIQKYSKIYSFFPLYTEAFSI